MAEIRHPPSEELEAFRRRQLSGLRRFLEVIVRNRAAAGVSVLQGNLGSSDPPGNKARSAGQQ